MRQGDKPRGRVQPCHKSNRATSDCHGKGPASSLRAGVRWRHGGFSGGGSDGVAGVEVFLVEGDAGDESAFHGSSEELGAKR